MGSKCFHNVPISEPEQLVNDLPKDDLLSTERIDKKLNNYNKLDTIQEEKPNSKMSTPSEKLKEKNLLSPPQINKGIKKHNDSSGHLRKKQKNFFINEKEELKEEYEKSVLKIIQKHNRNNQDEELIENCLKKHFFMKDLDKQARKEIIKEMSLVSVQSNTYLFKQGGIGNYFYILKEGSIELISRNDSSKQKIKIGESFGELALLHGANRYQSALTLSDCYLWVMERKNFRKIVDHITKMNYEENKNFIESIPILANIHHTQKTILCSFLYKENFQEGDFIVKKGDPAHCLYIVKEGEVDCSLNGKVVRTLRKGDNFGERSILVDSMRSLDCIAKTNCVCYSVSTSTLKSMLGDNFRNLLYLNFIKSAFNRSKIFSRFNVQLLDKVFHLFKPLNLKNTDIAYKENYLKSSKIVIVIDGHLINKITRDIVANRGTILFQYELFQNSDETTDFDIIPQPDCLLIEANTKEFLSLLGGSFKELMAQTELIKSLSKISILKNLPTNKLEYLVQVISEEKFEDGDNIVTEGENGDKFYIIKSGKVDIFINNKYIRTLNEKEHFGERALFFHEKRSATIKAVGEVTVFSISHEDFEKNIESNMKEYLMNRLYLQDNVIELKDLLFKMPLGTGNYGNVSLVRNKKNKFPYAIKAISRNQINAEQLHLNLELERSILLKIDHPFIVKLVKSLKDKNNVYFLMEYIKGKELFDVIRDIGLLNKPQTQFYGASLMLAVDYLHERKFIFRDIKPENVMVIQNGYLKLIDFGTAKEISDRTNTIIGTPHYMAPEVILGEGYSFQVDIWSIAICMYEFVCGGVPFGENAEEPMDVYLAIVNDKMIFPNFCKDSDFKLLMQQMLTKNPISRMSKFSQIKNHIWFNGFNWEDLISLNMEAPYKPSLKKDKEEKNDILFVDYIKSLGEEKANNSKIDPKTLAEYNNWWEKF